MERERRISQGALITRVLVCTALLGAMAGCPPAAQRVVEPLPPPAVPQIRVGPEPRATPPKLTKDLSQTRVMIDPGHGGHDPGAGQHTRSSVPEKTIVLDIGNRVAESLRQRSVQAYCTRNTDVFIELQDRAAAADRYRVDLFVSIHADSAQRASASGTEVHIYDAASAPSQQAALCMVGALKRAGIECRGVQRSNFHVLREHSRPAMLVECGFLTNPGDARNLNTPAFRAKLAEAIAEGVVDYLSR